MRPSAGCKAPPVKFRADGYNADMLRLALACAAILSAAVGCTGRNGRPQAGLATDVDPAIAQADHWLGQPADFAATHGRFQCLWDASERVLRRWLFTLERRDYRQGLLTTQPLISRQWFEFWRADTGSAGGVAESSLATIRRTVYCSFERTDGGFAVRPRVLVERLAVPGKGILDPEIPSRYWYAVGRDRQMERELAQAIQKQADGP